MIIKKLRKDTFLVFGEPVVIYDKQIDFFFIKFPVIFPIIYLSTLFAVPQYGSVIAFITLITLAEPHFGATWSVFFDKKMRCYARQNKLLFIVFPIVIAISVAFLFFRFSDIFYLLFFAFNIYHVTRQSAGICKLFSRSSTEKIYQEYSLYSINFLGFCGIVAYHLVHLISVDAAFLFGIFLLLVSLAVILVQTILFKSWDTSLTTLTGSLMFIPAFFVNEPIHALLAGITMHYSQYLVMMLKINLGKSQTNDSLNVPKSRSFSGYNYVLLISIYGAISVLLTFF